MACDSCSGPSGTDRFADQDRRRVGKLPEVCAHGVVAELAGRDRIQIILRHAPPIVDDKARIGGQVRCGSGGRLDLL